VTTTTADNLSRRERQIMETIYRRDGGTVSEVQENMPDPPSYSSVRAQLGILESKGHLKHRQEGRRYVYVATESTGRARKTALKGLMRTFFEDSPAQAVATLLDLEGDRVSDGELEELAALVDEARNKRS
jgi:predicted transcriptional regulator